MKEFGQKRRPKEDGFLSEGFRSQEEFEQENFVNKGPQTEEEWDSYFKSIDPAETFEEEEELPDMMRYPDEM